MIRCLQSPIRGGGLARGVGVTVTRDFTLRVLLGKIYHIHGNGWGQIEGLRGGGSNKRMRSVGVQLCKSIT